MMPRIVNLLGKEKAAYGGDSAIFALPWGDPLLGEQGRRPPREPAELTETVLDFARR